MIPAIMSDPMPSYNPLAIFDMHLSDTVSELKLKVKARYCDLNLNQGVAYFYLDLTDGTNSFLLPARYYQWLAAQNADYVYCKYQRVHRSNEILNVLEIARIPNTFLQYAPPNHVFNPLENGNIYLQQDYIPLQKEATEVTQILQKQSDYLYIGMATATINNIYIKAFSNLSNIFSIKQLGVQYRYLNIGQKIITDLEVFSI